LYCEHAALPDKPLEDLRVSRVNALAAFIIRSPLLWGGALFACFFALVQSGAISDPLVVRYLAGHWVEYVEVAMFCVGMAALGIKAIDLAAQRAGLGGDLLGDIPTGGQLPAEAEGLIEEVRDTGSYFSSRLRGALDLVLRTGSADDLEDHLKYLSDLDAAKAAQSYGLVRFVIWAIPIMGFLGTVIGITVAIASLSPTQMENISGVVAGLGTAFDTTATALALSMVLMFLQFMIDRFEQGLLSAVDSAAWRALAGRFQSTAGGDAAATAVARLGETLVRGTAKLVESQSQAWQALEAEAKARLEAMLVDAENRLASSMKGAIEAAVSGWTDRLVEAHDRLVATREDRLAAVGDSLAKAVEVFGRQQTALATQGELLSQVVDATRDLAGLERVLQANLETVTASGRFEETLATLTAAVHLLAARAGHVTAESGRVTLSGRSSGKAA
jgi:hypothetical protein